MSNHSITIADGVITIMFTGDMRDRAIASAFFDEYEQVIRDHDVSQPYRVLFSTRAVKLKSWTPYMSERTEKINNLLLERQMRGRVAIIFDNSIAMRLMKLFIESRLARKNPGIPQKFFFDEAEAVNWLREGQPVDTHANSTP